MLSKAIVKYIRISPRKVRLVIDLVRGKSLKDAMFILENLNKKGAIYVRELLISAFSNAKRTDKNLTERDVVVSKIFADGGPTLKRFRAGSMGRAGKIRKRTAHIHVELDRAKSLKVAEPLKEVKPAGKVKKAPVKKVEEKSNKKESKKKIVAAK